MEPYCMSLIGVCPYSCQYFHHKERRHHLLTHCQRKTIVQLQAKTFRHALFWLDGCSFLVQRKLIKCQNVQFWTCKVSRGTLSRWDCPYSRMLSHVWMLPPNTYTANGAIWWGKLLRGSNQGRSILIYLFKFYDPYITYPISSEFQWDSNETADVLLAAVLCGDKRCESSSHDQVCWLKTHYR